MRNSGFRHRSEKARGVMETFARPSVYPGARTLPAVWYTSPDVFAEEQERIFSCEWLCIGREETLFALAISSRPSAPERV